MAITRDGCTRALQPVKPQPVQLTYYVWDELLTGRIGEKSFSIRAVSGGGRGRLKGQPEYSLGSFSSYRKKDDKEGVRGGVLPPGLWRVEKPSKYKGKKKAPVSILVPINIDEPLKDLRPAQKTPYGRDYTEEPFLIHGRGPKGSDGCLVIEPIPRAALLHAVEAAQEEIYLRVTRVDWSNRLRWVGSPIAIG
jgi:hypothetical protein